MGKYSVVKSLGELEIRSEPEADDSYVDAALEDGGQTTEETSSVQRRYATVLSEEDIRELMKIDIQRVSEFTSLSKAEATLLLSHLSWDVNDICEKWFADAKKIRETVGLLELDPPSDDDEFVFGVCGHSPPPHENFASASCGHRICTLCWTSHINEIINEYLPSEWNLRLKCPVPVGLHASCTASIGQDMIERFASEKDKSKYNQQLLRSYVDNNKTMKWHFIRGSSYAIDFGPDSANSSVSCLRLLRFCWNCKEDAHSPLDCTTAANWVQEITVPCPKCQLRIQKNQDNSLKMKCLPCNYEFYWYCPVDWIEHGEDDLYICDFYAVSSDRIGEMAESAADSRYKDCYENWKSNESLMVKAEANLKNLDTLIENLSNTQLPTKPQLKFILEAGLQIIECTRFLKWTYVYGYYLGEDEVGKQNLLNQMQVDVKSLVGKLDDCVKTDLLSLLDAEGPSESFHLFRIKLTQLTSTARAHCENLVGVIENGLASE
ncbi:PREDICTED: probable E3 ubiquitin-protein ligase ARI12 [Camelina sativa]|uniref:RBR-type E3 ubiquitin transferase n=1 Tax=Camelina sativa TaxID=90675 RepID=A0ABM0XG21_CAMSA|nr:PREDICTED: probable E3 ubiquitin-protein ligase ARI12 [Camelina sativa]